MVERKKDGEEYGEKALNKKGTVKMEQGKLVRTYSDDHVSFSINRQNALRK